MNRERLAATRILIAAHPEHFDISDWIQRPAEDMRARLEGTEYDLLGECGTVGCIAAYVVASAGEHVQRATVMGRAMALLEIDSQEASRLFFLSEVWPGVDDEYVPTAADAAELLDRLLSGEVVL